MAKRFLSFAVLVVMAIVSLHAETLTVNDGTNTNSTMPLYGMYGDTYGARSQFVLSADGLSEMTGGTIEKLTFYSNSSSVTLTGTFAVNLKEVTESNVASGFISTTDATKVYEGTMTVSGYKLELTLSTPYVYSGGNLLIETIVRSAGNWVNHSYYGVSATSGSGRYVTASSGSGSTVSFLPKTTFDYVAGSTSCPRVATFEAKEVSDVTATLTWTTESDASAYNVVVTDGNMLLDTIVTGKSLALTGLTGNSDYLAQVRAICAEGDSSSFRNTSFHTDCSMLTPAQLGVVSFEASEGFETGSGKSSNCWTFGNLQNPTSTSYIPQVYGSYPFEGKNSLYMSAVSSSYTHGDSAYAILPALNFAGQLQNYYLSMRFRKSTATTSYNDTLYVGVMSDISDWSTLQIVGAVANGTTSYRKALVDFSSCTLTDGYVVLLAVTDSYSSESYKYASFYIDQVQLKAQKACAMPSNLTAKNLDYTSATLAWTGASSKYYVRVYDTKKIYFEGRVGADSLDLTGLKSGNTYTMYVDMATVCGAAGSSDTVEMSVTFTLPCQVVSELPWNEGFELMTVGNSTSSAPACWSMMNCNEGSYPYAFVNTSASYVHSGSQSLYFQSASNKNAYLLLPDFSMDLSQSDLTFWYKHESTTSYNGQFKVGYLTDESDEDTFVALQTMPIVNSWTQAKVALAALPAGKHIVISLAHGSGSNYYAAIDDLQISAPQSCLKTTGVDVISVAGDSAVIGWASVDSVMGYQVVALNGADTLFNGVVTDTLCVLKNLAPSTTYNLTIGVQTLCSASESSEVFEKAVSFVTDCAPIQLPWSEDFETMASGTSTDPAPACWNYINVNESSYPFAYVTTGTDYASSGTKYLKFVSSNTKEAYVVLPEFASLKGSELTFYYRNEGTGTNNGTLHVGYMDKADDASTYVEMTSLAQTTTKTKAAVSLDTVPAGAYVCFKYVGGSYSNYYLGIDDISVHALPTCFKPTNLRVDTVMGDTAVFAWTPAQQGGSEFQVALTKGADTLFSGLVQDTLLTLTGLATSTSYNVSLTVATACSATDISEAATAALSFSTPCEVITSFPWEQNFDDITSGTNIKDIPCYNGYSEVSTANYWGVTSISGRNSSNCAYIRYSSSYLGRTVGVMELPTMRLEAGKGYEFSYWIKKVTNASSDTISVFVNDSLLSAINTNDDITDTWGEFKHVLIGTGEEINLKFKFSNLDGYYGYVDDISIAEPTTCFPASNLRVDSVTANTAVLAWSPAEQGGSEFQVVVISGSDTLAQTTVQDTTLTLTGLQNGAYYGLDVEITTLCSATDHSKPYSSVISFTTDTTCFNVDNIRIDSIGQHEVTFAWTPGASETSYYVLVETMTDTLFAGVVNDTLLTLNGLAHSTDYIVLVAVKSVCSASEMSTGNYDVMSFTTECGPVDIFYGTPVEFNFDDETVGELVDEIRCFSVAKQGAAADWRVANGGAEKSNYSVEIGYSDDTVRTYATMNLPQISFLPGHCYEVRFSVKGSKYASTDTLYASINNSTVNHAIAMGEKADWIQYVDTFWAQGVGGLSFVYATLDGFAAQVDNITFSELLTYEISFADETGAVVQNGRILAGETPVYGGETPVKAATAQYTYTFSGWSPAIAPATEDVVYVPQFDSVVNVYSVTFKDWDGTVLKQEDVAYGSAATAPADPVREGYNFTGWDADYSSITGNLVVTAQYEIISGLDDIAAKKGEGVRKVIVDGVVYIIKGDRVYLTTGQRVR